MTAPARFDEAYYHRHYAGRARVHSAREIGRLAQGVTGLAAWLGVELRAVLDVGAGPGLWRDWFRRHRPGVRYRSTDVSPYACARYGHERRDIARWRPPGRYDLVVCQGVLPYLADGEAEAAIAHLGQACRGLLYLEALTRRDLREVADRSRTDLGIHGRSGDWYRRRLARWFRQVGAGLWVSRASPVGLWELEAAGRAPPRSAGPC